ncbi:MAG: CRISPR-associated endonuclease Cas1 [Chloroflexota bacterium]
MAIVKHLIADTFGTHIGKYSGRLKITQKGTTLQQAPLMHLDAVHVISRGVSISSDALAACCESGIPVHYLDERGTPYATVYSAGLVGTVLTRREQLRAYDDERGYHVAVMMATGKIQNQANTLRYLARNRKDTPAGDELLLLAGEVADHLQSIEALPPQYVDDLRTPLMSIEAHAAKLYWEGTRHVVPEDYGWKKRTGRGATDPINSLLNYGYGILYGQTERALTLAGLDPYAGFIHADRPGKPSLILDFIEEFRQVAVDRVVFGLAARQFTVEQDGHGHMCVDTRRTFAEHILKHLESNVRYEGQRQPLRVVMQTQARRLVAYLRHECEAYTPFRAEV